MFLYIGNVVSFSLPNFILKAKSLDKNDNNKVLLLVYIEVEKYLFQKG